MGGGSSKAEMAAPIIVKETERHLATVSEYYSSALVTLLLLSLFSPVNDGSLAGVETISVAWDPTVSYHLFVNIKCNN